jgi:hypothetical protein
MKLHREPFYFGTAWFLKIWTGQCHGLRSYRRRLLQLVRGMGLQRILASREMDRGPARGSSEVDE